MFRLFPKERQDWLRAFLFPFQAFVILAPASYCYLLHIWPHRGGVEPLNHFGHQLLFGFAICFLVLLGVGVYQRGVSRYVNLCLAALTALEMYLTPDFIQL